MNRRNLLLVVCLVAAGCGDESGLRPGSPDASMGRPQFGWKLERFSEFHSPVRIALAPDGGLLVSDSRMEAVVTVDPVTRLPDGAMKVRGKPLAVGMLGPRIFVGNATTERVEVYDRRGRLWYSFGMPVSYPTDLAIDETRNLVFVADGAEHDVKVFDFKGDLERTIGGPGSAAGAALHIPTGIAVDPVRQEVLVSDYPDPSVGGSAAVRIYNYEGGLVATLSPGSCGYASCSGGFSRPQGIALDGAGRIYLVDAFLGQVLVFDRETLVRVATLGGWNVGPPYLRIPMDVVVTPGADLFVTSNANGSVEVFPGGAAP